jgi:hypothetical protein
VLGVSFRIPFFPSNGVLWFVSLVLWLYLLFPILFAAIKSKYRFILLFLLFLLSLFVRNYSSFRYPANSISANLFNFYLGMLVLEHEDSLFQKMKDNKGKVLFTMLISLILYVFYAGHINTLLTYGVAIFCCLYILFTIFISIMSRINQWLYPVNSLIMFLVFLHIPARSIRDIMLTNSIESDWRNIFLAYIVYFTYIFVLAGLTNKLYCTIQTKLRTKSLWI